MEKKNSIKGLNRRAEQTEERIRELEDRSIEMIQSKKQEEKGVKKNELRSLKNCGEPPKIPVYA